MDSLDDRSTILRIRKCVVCGEAFGLFRSIAHGDDCGASVREFVYSTRALPLVDHVHDDSYQDYSAFAPADSRLQVSGPVDQEGVRSGFPSVEEMLADLQRVAFSDAAQAASGQPDVDILKGLVNSLQGYYDRIQAFDLGVTLGAISRLPMDKGH